MELNRGTLTLSGLFSNEEVTVSFDESIKCTTEGDKSVLHLKDFTGTITVSRQVH